MITLPLETLNSTAERIRNISKSRPKKKNNKYIPNMRKHLELIERNKILKY